MWVQVRRKLETFTFAITHIGGSSSTCSKLLISEINSLSTAIATKNAIEAGTPCVSVFPSIPLCKFAQHHS